MQMFSALASGDWIQFFGSLTVALLLLLICFPVHELAHAYIADRLGDQTARLQGRVTLNPLAHLDPIGSVLFMVTGFGWAKPVPVNVYRLRGNTKTSWAFVALAGPASNVAMAIVFALIYRLVEPLLLSALPRDAALVIANGFFFAVILNLYLALFNLIPVPPLDGSRILAAVLPDQAGAILDQLERYGFLILMVLLIAVPSVLSSLVAEPAATLTALLMGY